MMDHIFKDYINEDWLIDFIDDLLIFAETKEQLKEQTLKVLKRLRENNLFLKPEKAEFCQTKISFLGMIIEQGKISMDPTKVKGIRDWPAPTMVKEVRQFLGFGNFYRKFIRKYSHITRLLNDLLKKTSSFHWRVCYGIVSIIVVKEYSHLSDWESTGVFVSISTCLHTVVNFNCCTITTDMK